MDVNNLDTFGKVNLRIFEDVSLEELLVLMLAPRGLKAERDSAGIFHIKATEGVWVMTGAQNPPSGFEISPPFEFPGTPLKHVFDSIFFGAQECSYIYDLEERNLEENVTFRLLHRLPLEDVLKMILKSTQVTFCRDSKGIFHILRNDSLLKPEEKEITADVVLAEQDERPVMAPLEFKNIKLAEFLEKVLPGAYIIELNGAEDPGKVDLRLSEPLPLFKVLEIALSPVGLVAELDGKGIYHIKKGQRPDSKEKYPLTKKDNYYVEPPLEFIDIPLFLVLETVFVQNSKGSFILDVSDIQQAANVNMALRKRIDLAAFLKLVLEPRGYTFYADRFGVIHIAKYGGSWKHPEEVPLQEEKEAVRIQDYYYDPPFEYADRPLLEVLRDIFNKAGLSYVVDAKNTWEPLKVNIMLAERTQLETLLVLLLEHRKLAFELDKRGVFHIKAAPVEVMAATPMFSMVDIGKKSEMAERIDKYLEKTLGELGITGVRGLALKEGLIKIFGSVGRNFSDSSLPDIKVYGVITADISGGKTLGVILKEVLQPKGLTFYISANGVFNIVKSESRENYTAKRYFNYESSKESFANIKAELERKLTPGAKIEVDEKSKTLTLTDTPEKIDEVESYLYYGM